MSCSCFVSEGKISHADSRAIPLQIMTLIAEMGREKCWNFTSSHVKTIRKSNITALRSNFDPKPAFH